MEVVTIFLENFGPLVGQTGTGKHEQGMGCGLTTIPVVSRLYCENNNSM
jgi:hypothetical protein